MNNAVLAVISSVQKVGAEGVAAPGTHIGKASNQKIEIKI